MNVERILAVADAIEQHSIAYLGFNMGVALDRADAAHGDLTGQECGTVACAGGWTVSLFEPWRIGLPGNIMSDAERILGLSLEQSIGLFTPPGYSHNIHSPADAVQALRHLAATGEVVWTTSAAQAA